MEKFSKEQKIAAAGLLLLALIFVVWRTPAAAWVEIIKAAAWPASIVAVVLLFAFHPRLNRLFGLAKAIKKIKAGGVEMEINTEAVDAVRTLVGESFDELVTNAKDEYDRMAGVTRLGDHLQHVMTASLPYALRSEGIATLPAGVRGTVHVRDIVFTEYLYQLLDYYPTREGRGRRFPLRYGIIGRSWRLAETLGEGNAFAAGKGEERTLIEEWGMTLAEVQNRGRNRPAYLSVLLRAVEDDNFPIGILYIDTTEAEGFGEDEKATRVARQIEASSEVAALRKALERALAPLWVAAPNLDIGRSSR